MPFILKMVIFNNFYRPITPFPSSLHMSKEGEKKTLTSTTFPLNGKILKK